MEEGIGSSVFRGGERFLEGRAEIGNSSVFFSYLKKKARWVPQVYKHIITNNYNNSHRLEMRNNSAELFPRKIVQGVFKAHIPKPSIIMV